VRLCPDLPARHAAACAVVAHAAVVVTDDELPGLRQRPGPAPGEPPPASFLRQADEQTVAGLVAVYHALRDHHLGTAGLAGWGVIAAPELLARAIMAPTLQRFAEEGAWGISPHLIPHRSLHAPSGTISQALGLHGPNFGVGGSPGAASEALLVAGALLAGGALPGLWVVLTGGAPTEAGLVWRAAALALVPDRPGLQAPRLHIAAGPVPGPGWGPAAERFAASGPADAADDDPAAWPALTLGALLTVLSGARRLGEARWRLGCGGWVRLAPAGAGAEGRP
jgi:hypothetical protein